MTGSVHVRIAGRVQGVGFRWFVREEARRLGLSGRVTNLDDGRVEVAASGAQASLDRLLSALRVGPPGCRVDTVDVLGPVGGSLPYPFAIQR